MAVPFESPTTLMLAGPTQSGKSYWVKRLLSHKNVMFKTSPNKVVYAYGARQAMFGEMQDVTFHSGLPSRENIEEWTKDGQHMLLILDDVMQEACSSSDIMALFTIHCHHRNITVLFLTQSIFPPGKCARTISLNCHYIVIFKTKRDKLQVQTIGTQIFPGQKAYFMDAYQNATSEAYGYLVCDLHPGTDKKYQLRTHIFPDEDTWVYSPL